jgi:hypothetical protein
MIHTLMAAALKFQSQLLVMSATVTSDIVREVTRALLHLNQLLIKAEMEKVSLAWRDINFAQHHQQHSV